MLKNRNFVERSITGALSFLRDSVLCDSFVTEKGFLQSLDPRIKTVTLLLFVIQVLFARNIILLVFLYALSVLLAYLSEIRPLFFLKRTWTFIPLFALLIAIPAIFSIFTPGEALATLRVAGLKLVITRQGLSGATMFVLRVAASVSFVVLLSLTTRHFELLKVMRVFKIPQIFVMTLGMCYRYIFLFVAVIENTFLAVKSRAGIRIGCKEGRRIVASNIASMWHRSYQMNENVYLAMLSRGYTGEPVVLNGFRAKPRDWVWLVCVLLMSMGMFFSNYQTRL